MSLLSVSDRKLKVRIEKSTRAFRYRNYRLFLPVRVSL